MYKMNVWRYSPVVKAIAVNEKEELDYGMIVIAQDSQLTAFILSLTSNKPFLH